LRTLVCSLTAAFEEGWTCFDRFWSRFIYALMVGFIFFPEFLRGDNRGIVIKGVDLYPSQFISVFCDVIALLMLIKLKEGEKAHIKQ